MKTLEALDPLTQKFIDEITVKAGPTLYKMKISDARAAFNDMQSEPGDKQFLHVQERKIPGGPQGDISITIFKPQKKKEKLPVLLFFHGGGWILGSLKAFERFICSLALNTETAVVFVDYHLSPEVKFPVAIEEAYTATKFIAEQGEQWGLDTNRIAVFGESAGGNMATVVTLMAKERKGPHITTQVLLYPVTDAQFNTSSYTQFADGPFVIKPEMEWFWNAYEPTVSKRKNPWISPLQASIDHLKNLPPALVITAENDVLRDEGEAYAHKLMKANVPVTAARFLGTIHGFMAINALKETLAAKQALHLVYEHLQKCFKK